MILKIRTEAKLSEAVRCQIVDTIGRYSKSSKIANKCLGGEAIQMKKTKKEYDEKWNGEHPERRKAINHNNYLKNREKRLEWNRQNRRKRLYEYYIRNAEARGIEFQLSREEFWELANDVCCYCGSSDNVGVDRADNNIGYVIENCVPCCGMCNKMKNKYSQDTFVEHCKRVAEYCG